MTLKHPHLSKPVSSGRREKDEPVRVNGSAIRGVLAEGIERNYRAASLGANSFDPSTFTVDAVFSTFAPVRRAGYVEKLDPAGLELADLIGAPFLDGHRQASGTNIIGVVQSAHMSDTQLFGTIRLVQSDDAKPIVDRIKDGFLRDVSIGYRVLKWAETQDPVTGERTRTAVRWSVFEVSAVPVGADPRAKIRSFQMDSELENENTAMPEAEQTAIRSLGELADLPPSWAASQIEANATIEQARAAVRKELATRSAPVQRIRVQAPPLMEDPSTRLRAIEEALSVRVNGGTPSDVARAFMGHTLRDIARETLALRGVATAGMDSDTLFRTAMHTTSDFKNLLTGVGNRTLRPAYEAAQSPVKAALARQALRTDFRAGTSLRLGELGQLQKVSEAGEIKSTTRGEAADSYAIDTYASMFTISRKALINDDLGAFRDWGTAAGQAAAQTEAALLFGLLTQSGGAGPAMGEDGKRMFHADHGNLIAEAALGLQSLAAARLAMRQQKGLDRKTPIQVSPKYLLVGPRLETFAEMLLSKVVPDNYASANPFAGKLELLVEPRITDFSWYLFADPATMPALEYSYLAEAPGPQLASREGFEVLATEFRVHLDFGAGAVDWRGAYRSGGAEVSIIG